MFACLHPDDRFSYPATIWFHPDNENPDLVDPYTALHCLFANAVEIEAALGVCDLHKLTGSPRGLWSSTK